MPGIHRRTFLADLGHGLTGLVLGAMLHRDGVARATPGAWSPPDGKPHFPPKAKSVIWLFMNGGPSQVDTWDYKPELEKRDGKELEGFDQNTGFFTDQVGPIMKSPFKFHRHGKSGTWVSEIFPNIAKHVDDLALIYSCYTHTNNHSPALFEINTGMNRMGFPCLGAWLTYGLGTENQNLPGFITIKPFPRVTPKTGDLASCPASTRAPL